MFTITFIMFAISEHSHGANLIQYMHVNINKAVTLPCTFNEEADKMRWFFQQNPGEKETFAFDSNILPYEGYDGHCDGRKRFCNLNISVATKDLAGRYRFEFGQKGDHMKPGCIYELTVGNLECTSNIRKNQVMVGESDCPLKPDTIHRSCSFHHRGNIDGPLRFVWLKKITEDTILRHKILINVQEESQGNERILIVNDDFLVTSDMQGITFECSLEGYRHIIPCKLPPVSVEYVKRYERPKVNITRLSDNQVITCSVNKSQSLKCSYHWLLNHQKSELKIQSQNINKEHLVMSGDFKCMGHCQFASGEECFISGNVISFIKAESFNATGYIVSIVIFCVLLVCLTASAVKLFNLRRKKSQEQGNRTTRKHSSHI